MILPELEEGAACDGSHLELLKPPYCVADDLGKTGGVWPAADNPPTVPEDVGNPRDFDGLGFACVTGDKTEAMKSTSIGAHEPGGVIVKFTRGSWTTSKKFWEGSNAQALPHCIYTQYILLCPEKSRRNERKYSEKISNE